MCFQRITTDARAVCFSSYKNEDFLRLFADRVQKFCFGNGPLTPESAAERWIKRAGQIEKAVVAESARWGDYRRDVHPYQPVGPFELYNKEDHWLPQMDYVVNTDFPSRTDVFISQLRKAKLYPSVMPRFICLMVTVSLRIK